MTGLGWARLRSQPAQAVLVGALSGVLALTAVLGLAYARAVEESVQRTTLRTAPSDVRGLQVQVETERPRSPDELRTALAPEVDRPTWGAPIGGATANALVSAPSGQVLVPLVARDDVCAHLIMESGRCSTGQGEVVVAQSTASLAGLRLGSRFDVIDASAGSDTRTPVLRGLRVVGLYAQPKDLDAYWFNRKLAASATGDARVTPSSAVMLGWPTLSGGRWRSLTASVDVPLDVERLTVARVPQARSDLEALQRKASTTNGRTATQLSPLLDQVAQQRFEARAPLPLLGLQGVLLALVVLVYVAAATTEQRRPEVALARLRGQLPGDAARMLVRELAGVVVVGCAVGGVLGWFLARAAAARWLEPGVPVVVSWTLLAAVAACAVTAVVAVTFTAVPTVREPLVTLLRSVPPRSSTLRAGIADGAVVALCVAGLVTLLGDDAGSPTALVAPGLLALAGGLLLSQAVVPVAGALGRTLLARGGIATGLACVAVSRRPALRRLVAIETVAVALLVFAGAAGAVGAHQRETAAQRSVGAPVVLTVRSDNPTELLQAVARADPGGRYAAPVMAAHPASGTGTTTLAVDPQRFSRVAMWDDSGDTGTGAPSLAGLTPKAAVPIEVTGTRLALDVDFRWAGYVPGPDDPGGGLMSAGLLKPARLVVHLADRRGVLRSVDLGVLRTGRQRLAADVPCDAGCRLRVVELRRDPADPGAAVLDVVVSAATVDGRALDLRPGDLGWRITGFLDDAKTDDRGGLHGTGRGRQANLLLARTDLPLTVPALVTAGVGATPYGVDEGGDPSLDQGELVSGPAIGGSDTSYHRVGTASRLPGAPNPALVVSLQASRELDGPAPATTTAQVWLAADDSEREAALSSSLAAAGLPVVSRTTVAEVARAADQRGTGLSLHLATVIGVVALLLAASVLAVAVATSGRVRAYDLAGLRAVGVPRRTVVRAAVREQLLVAVVGVVSGAVLGAVGAALTLSRGRDAGLPPPQVLSGTGAVLLLLAVSAVLLVGVCLGLGARLGRQARPSLLREAAR